MTPPQRDAKVIDKINSTLGLYALVALIIEAGLITAVVMTAGTDRTLLIGGLLLGTSNNSLCGGSGSQMRRRIMNVVQPFK
jgi:hypothetical protein